MRPLSPKALALGAYGAAALLSAFVAVILLQLWNADLRVPFDYRGDSLSYGMIVKSIVENGGCLTVPQLSAPGHLHMNDFPFALDWTHILAIRALSLFSADWALIFNVYFLLGFPLIACSALLVFRHFHISFAPALLGSILYAFLTIRMIKGEGHLFLDIFYQVPLAVLLVLWVCSDTPPLVGRSHPLDLRSRRSRASLLVCLLVGTTGFYYAFFIVFLLIIGGLWASAEHRTLRNAIAGIALSGAIYAVIGVGLMPVWLYRMKHGSNPEVASRLPQEAELYGLKIAQLLEPVSQHRINIFARFTTGYNSFAPVVGDGAISLGAIGTVGFLILLVRIVLSRNSSNAHGHLLRRLGTLNWAAVLFATMGGFGSLFAWLVSPQIRAYARMGVIIGFLSILAFVLMLDHFGRRHSWAARLAPPLLLALGLLDQVTTAAIRPYTATKAAFAADRELVQRIEARVAHGAMIFELPYLSYPEGGDINRMGDYDPVRPYLQSCSLRWSYPAMRGRFEDLWIRQVSAYEPERLVAELSSADFEGILVDRPGYADGGSHLEEALRRELGETPDVSVDGRLAFFALTSYNTRILANVSANERELRRDNAIHPLLMRWGAGFSYPETSPDGPFRWCDAAGELWVQNGSATPKLASLSMKAYAAHPPSSLLLGGDLLSGAVELSTGGTVLTREFVIPPGEHVIRFHSDSKPVEAPLGPRTLIWRADNMALTEVGQPRTH